MNPGEFRVLLTLTVGKCLSAASDDVQSGCHQPGCWGGAQVWRQTQRLYQPQKTVLEVAERPGRLRIEVCVSCLTVGFNAVQLQGSETHIFVCILQSTTGLKRKWRSTRRDTGGENCRASSTTRPLSRWSRNRSSSWRSRHSRDSRILEVCVEYVIDLSHRTLPSNQAASCLIIHCDVVRQSPNCG